MYVYVLTFFLNYTSSILVSILEILPSRASHTVFSFKHLIFTTYLQRFSKKLVVVREVSVIFQAFMSGTERMKEENWYLHQKL